MTKRKLVTILIVGGLLLIPYLFAMPWTLSDYLVAALLLLSTGLALEAVMSRVSDRKRKIILLSGLIILLIYIWTELAVGIFTTLGS